MRGISLAAPLQVFFLESRQAVAASGTVVLHGKAICRKKERAAPFFGAAMTAANCRYALAVATAGAASVASDSVTSPPSILLASA